MAFFDFLGLALLNMIEITNTCGAWYRRKRLDYLLDRVIEHTELKTYQVLLSVVFVKPQAIRKMNAHFRKKDTSTNILTFVLEKTARRVQAEIVLCPDVIRKESHSLRIPYTWHLERLWVHGLLHTAGVHHDTERSAQVMERLEQKILQRKW